MATHKHTPAKLNLEMVRGEHWAMGQTISIDLTGYTVESAIILDDGTEVPITTVVEPGDPSRIDFYLSANQTGAMPLGKVEWYLAWTPPEDYRRTILEGDVSVKRVG